MAESLRSDWTINNIWYLALMTFGYIFGEIAHFLINTTSREVARGKKHFYSFKHLRHAGSGIRVLRPDRNDLIRNIY